MDREAFAILAFAAMLGAYVLGVFARDQGAGISTDNNEGGTFDIEGIATEMTSALTPTPTANPTRLSAAGLNALKLREGFAAKPYADHKGWSIGYGHLMQGGEALQQVSMAQALDILANDVAWAEKAVSQAITAPIVQSQFDALVSFAFNVGAGAFAKSTLVKRINRSDPGAAQEFDRWVYASGEVNTALVRRRQSEAAQFESAIA